MKRKKIEIYLEYNNKREIDQIFFYSRVFRNEKAQNISIDFPVT